MINILVRPSYYQKELSFYCPFLSMLCYCLSICSDYFKKNYVSLRSVTMEIKNNFNSFLKCNIKARFD